MEKPNEKPNEKIVPISENTLVSMVVTQAYQKEPPKKEPTKWTYQHLDFCNKFGRERIRDIDLAIKVLEDLKHQIKE